MDCLTSCVPSLSTVYFRTTKQRIDHQASSIIDTIFSAEKPGSSLKQSIDDIITPYGGWSERLACAVLDRLVQAIEAGKRYSTAMATALEKSGAAAMEFSKEHPVYTTVIALGVLIVLMPWVLELLGFGELGPIEGTVL